MENTNQENCTTSCQTHEKCCKGKKMVRCVLGVVLIVAVIVLIAVVI